jgi:hypothetical protein
VLPVLIRQRRATAIGYALGSAIGAETTVLLQSAAHLFSDGTERTLGFQASWFVVGGMGALLGGAIGARSVRADGPRLARGRAVTIEDYVEPLERWIPWTAATVAAAVSLLPLLLGGPRSALVPGIAAVATVLAASLAARWIIARPQRADSVITLAWDDALRAEAVRNLLGGAGVVALATLIFSLPTALARLGVAARTVDLQLWASMGFCIVLLVLAVASSRRRPARYFLRRLWPGTAAELAENERAKEVQR